MIRIIALVAVLIAWPVSLAQAGGVVGNGTAASCTDAALDAALILGGTVTFNCGAAPVTIVTQNLKQIVHDTTIDGGGRVTLDGNGTHGVLSVGTGSAVTLANLTVANGNAGSGGGGGVSNLGRLTVRNSRLVGNTAAQGGGIYTSQTLDVENSTFSGNRAMGGGIFSAGGAVTVSRSTFSDNVSNFVGGGLLVDAGSAAITNSTFSRNVAFANGGGLYSRGLVSLTNSTLSGNAAEPSGGGAGIYALEGTVALRNTIIANSRLLGGLDCARETSGAFADGGHNLDSDGTCGFQAGTGSLSGVDPRLTALAGNGGSTATFAPCLGPGVPAASCTGRSPAIDAGDNATCPATDQRGALRPWDGDGNGVAVCDIGSYEALSVVGGLADPAHCIASGGGLVDGVVGDSLSFIVSSFDVNGDPVHTGGRNIQAQFLAPSPSAPAVTIVDNGNGFYTGSYTPTVAGTYTLQITMDGVPIHDSPFTVTIARGPNRAPVADAGGPQTVNEGARVTLDGAASTDPDGDALTYTWSQINTANPVALDLGDPRHPTFTAPFVDPGGTTLTFQLVVSDGVLTSAAAVVNVTVKDVNHPPVASAGTPQTVDEGTRVTLNGTGSYDPDGDGLTYAWTADPPLTLDNASSPQPSFVAPHAAGGRTTLRFTLTVSDGIATATDTVTVTVENVNHPPVASATALPTVNEGSSVTLEGAGSDPDGDALTYRWSQVGGPAVVLSDVHAASPTFVAPMVGPGGRTLAFELVVNDGLADSLPASVDVVVQDVNDPPACGQALASPAMLWPPNHTLVPIGITGVTDPDNGHVTLAVTAVTQDEPVNGSGDGDTSPDAVVQGGQLLLRAERSAPGNGRVYRVSFRADDGQGGTCTGRVTVCVPRDQKTAACTDDGQRYDAFGH